MSPAEQTLKVQWSCTRAQVVVDSVMYRCKPVYIWDSHACVCPHGYVCKQEGRAVRAAEVASPHW